MPRTRLLTAFVLLGLVLLLLWRGTLGWLVTVFAAVTLRAAWEWAGLCPALTGGLLGGLTGMRRWILLVALAVCMAGLWALPAAVGVVALTSALGWWALALWLVVRYPTLPPWLENPLAQATIILLALAPAWLALSRLADGRRPLLVLCLALVWAADSAAYLVGRRLGTRRLCPKVSPAKTVEGFLGGLAGAALAGLVAGFAWRLDGAHLAVLVTLTVACAALSVVGDLAESLFKRRAGVKDSGHLLPGHGGVLDRIDALIAAAPLFALTVPLLVRG